MIKSSSTDLPLSPEEAQEASNLFGRSLFSAIQLAKEKELRKVLEKKYSGFDDANVLRIPLPAELMPSAKVAEDASDGFLSRALKLQDHPVRSLLASQQGFSDAKKDFYNSEKARIHKELARAQKEYIDTLHRIKTGAEKAELSTPCVDAFCNGMAYQVMFEKEAADPNDTDIEDGTIMRLLAQAGGLAKRPFQPAIDTAASGLLGTGAGAAYLTYMLRKNMREPRDLPEEQLPTRVELEPYV
jgi:hypothetical protein